MLATVFGITIAMFLYQTLRMLYPPPPAHMLNRDTRTMSDETDWRWFERQDVTQV